MIIQKTQLTSNREELQAKIASWTSQLIESEAAILVSLQLKESEAMIESLTSQLNESNDKLSHSSSLNQQLEKNNASLSSQLNEARNQLSEVEKNYKLLSGDREALSSTSLEQCDEVILTLTRSQEKLQQRRVSDFIDFILHSHHMYT